MRKQWLALATAATLVVAGTAPALASVSISLPQDAELILGLVGHPAGEVALHRFQTGRFTAAMATLGDALKQSSSNNQSTDEGDLVLSQVPAHRAFGQHGLAARCAEVALAVYKSANASMDRVLLAEWAALSATIDGGHLAKAIQSASHLPLRHMQSPVWPLYTGRVAGLLAEVGQYAASLELWRLVLARSALHGSAYTAQTHLPPEVAPALHATQGGDPQLPPTGGLRKTRLAMRRPLKFFTRQPGLLDWRAVHRDLALLLQEMDLRRASRDLAEEAMRGLLPAGASAGWPDAVVWTESLMTLLDAQTESAVAGVAVLGVRKMSRITYTDTAGHARDEAQVSFVHAQREVSRGAYAAAEGHLKAVLAADRARVGKDHPALIRTWVALAYVRLEQGMVEAAEEALTAGSAILHAQHALTAAAVDSLYLLYYSATLEWFQGRLLSAMAMYAQVFREARQSLGHHHALVATAVTQWAYLSEEVLVQRLFDRCMVPDSAHVDCVGCLHCEEDSDSCPSCCAGGADDLPPPPHEGDLDPCEADLLYLEAARRALPILQRAHARWLAVEDYRLNLDYQYLSKRLALTQFKVDTADSASAIERGVLSVVMMADTSLRRGKTLFHSAVEAMLVARTSLLQFDHAHAYVTAAERVVTREVLAALKEGSVHFAPRPPTAGPLTPLFIAGGRSDEGTPPAQHTGADVLTGQATLHGMSEAARTGKWRYDALSPLRSVLQHAYPGLRVLSATPLGHSAIPTNASLFWAGYGAAQDLLRQLQAPAEASSHGAVTSRAALRRRCVKARLSDVTSLHLQAQIRREALRNPTGPVSQVVLQDMHPALRQQVMTQLGVASTPPTGLLAGIQQYFSARPEAPPADRGHGVRAATERLRHLLRAEPQSVLAARMMQDAGHAMPAVVAALRQVESDPREFGRLLQQLVVPPATSVPDAEPGASGTGPAAEEEGSGGAAPLPRKVQRRRRVKKARAKVAG